MNEFNLKHEAEKKIKFYSDKSEIKIIKKEWIPIIHISNKTLNKFNFDYNDYIIKRLYFSNSTIKCFVLDNIINFKMIKNNILSIFFEDCLFTNNILKWKEIHGTLDFWNNKNNLECFNITYNNTNNKTWSLNFYNFRIINFKINKIDNDNKVSKFSKIYIYNNIKLNELLINNIVIWELILESINNNFESFEIRNCKIDKLIIRNSNLWKAVFNWVEIWELEIENATLNDCIFNWVDFYNNYKLSNNNWNISTRTLKDNYRQLKHVMDKNWNHTEANKFFALEMEYHSKSPNLSLYENFSLWVQKFVNNFWGNWFRNFVIILFFACLCTLINYFYLLMFYDLIKFDFILTFFNLLSPFYGLWKDTFNTLNLDLPLYWSFILYKIIYWILIYQLIIALKRTTKR